MRKFYSISLLFLLCFMLQAKAQTANPDFKFVTTAGQVIEDGATIKSNNATDDPFSGSGKLIKESFIIENIRKQDYIAYIQYTINSLEGKSLGVCFNGDCTEEVGVGTYQMDQQQLLATDQTKYTADVDFTFETKGKGSITVQLFYQSILSEDGDPFIAGPKVTYEFTSETTGINATKATNIAYYNVFNLQGIQVLNKAASLSGLQAGTYIVQAYDNKGLISTTKQIIH